MPVSGIQHRVSVGLFQGRMITCKSYTNFSMVSNILTCLLAGVICLLTRASFPILFDCLHLSTVMSRKHDGIYTIPVIYDFMSCVIFCMCYPIPLMTFFRGVIPNVHNIRIISSYLESMNFVLICVSPVLYNLHYMLIILSGDVELNPGPSLLDICHVNIRGLSPVKLLAIRQELADIYSIISLSETFLSSASTHNLEIPGFYPVFRRDRGTFGGGVACYVRHNLVVKRREDLEILGMECLWLEIRTNNNKFLLCTCYRPPDARNSFWDELQFMVDLTRTGQIDNVIITGDLNADPATVNGAKLSQFITVNELSLHVHEPTRITETTASILDQFISNIPHLILDAKVLPPLLTNDHCTIAIKLRFKISKMQSTDRLVWLYKDADFVGLNNAIQLTDWNPCFQDNNVNLACKKWTEQFLNLARHHIPNKVVKIRLGDKPWFNTELRKLLQQKNVAHRKAKRSNSTEDWANFRFVRNTYTGKIRDASAAYKQRLATKLINKNTTGQKGWWNIARQFMGNVKSSQIPAMKYGDSIVNDSHQKAAKFNSTFLQFSSIDTADASIPEVIFATDSRLSSIIVEVEETMDIIRSLNINKASGPDGISCRMLKETAYSIAPSLTRLIQLSLSTNEFPECWKEANVLPIFKKGDRCDFDNYRPVSLLNICSKVCEKVIFKYLFNYCRDNCLISRHQSGFIPGDSTVHQLVYLYNAFCKALDERC